jgi:diketogulonate reductase-like aldo/keto reductase
MLTAGYGTEEELGVALQEAEVRRDQLFVTTKVLKNIKDPENALKTSLKKLKIDYVDLYLIHAPFDVEIEKAWKSLEDLRDQGYSPLKWTNCRIGKEYRCVELQNR